MRVVIAGGHGKIALLLGKALVERADTAVGIVRNPDHVGALAGLSIDSAVVDLEQSSVDKVAGVLTGADAAVFAAGAGPGSGTARKDSVDRAAAVLLADAAAAAGVRRFLLVSSMGVESVRGGATPSGVDEVFVTYLRAKLAAEEDILARATLDATVLRPGGLTDDPGTGLVRLAPQVERGSIPRADVAAVLLALLDRRPAARVLELVAGDTPIAAAILPST